MGKRGEAFSGNSDFHTPWTHWDSQTEKASCWIRLHRPGVSLLNDSYSPSEITVCVEMSGCFRSRVVQKLRSWRQKTSRVDPQGNRASLCFPTICIKCKKSRKSPPACVDFLHLAPPWRKRALTLQVVSAQGEVTNALHLEEIRRNFLMGCWTYVEAFLLQLWVQLNFTWHIPGTLTQLFLVSLNAWDANIFSKC